MKNLIYIFVTAIFLLFGCSLDEPSVTSTELDLGDANFQSYVAIGNSLTAGYQSGALTQSHQINSFPNLIAQQAGVSTFDQPLLGYPGVGSYSQDANPAGILELVIIDNPATDTGSPDPIIAPQYYSDYPGFVTSAFFPYYSQEVMTLPKPYNNLGVPGATVGEILNNTTLNGGFFQIVSRTATVPVWQQALALSPTFITLWAGNNDVLGFATTGGTSPTEPTDATQFATDFNTLLAGLTSGGAQVAVANIPDVTAIPFFTTLGPQVSAALAGAKAMSPSIVGLYYEKHQEIIPDPTTGFTNFEESQPPLLTLAGIEYASLLGHPTGKWYRDLAEKTGTPINYLLNNVYAGVDTTKPFGFHPQNPWPDALVLDADEIQTAATATASFNATIAASVSDKVVLVDINSFFSEMVSVNNGEPVGYEVGGYKFTAEFLTGGMFSLDGVHPTDLGYAIVANEFIRAINSKFNASIPLVNIIDKMGKNADLNASYAPKALDNVVKLFAK